MKLSAKVLVVGCVSLSRTRLGDLNPVGREEVTGRGSSAFGRVTGAGLSLWRKPGVHNATVLWSMQVGVGWVNSWRSVRSVWSYLQGCNDASEGHRPKRRNLNLTELQDWSLPSCPFYNKEAEPYW